MRNCWYVPALVFCSRIMKEKKQENMSENNNGSSTWDNFSWHFSSCNLDGCSKNLNIKNCCMVCGRRLLSKAKDCTNNFKSCLVIVWAFWMKMLVVKDARGQLKSTNKLDGILLSCHCYLKLLIIWSTHFPVSIF